MSKSADWLPNNRADQLTMAKNWLDSFKQQTAAAENKAAAWGVSASAVTTLAARADAAAAALAEAQKEETRTPVATARCRTAFEELAARMRDIKKRWFFVPPLTEADLVGLGIRPRDTSLTASGTPGAQVSVETYLVGRHQLGVKILYVTGSPSDSANKGYRIWYSLTAPGETPPASPDDLRKTFFTKRKKDIIDFDFGDSGKTAHFAVRVENEGKQGSWGPLVSALIP